MSDQHSPPQGRHLPSSGNHRPIRLMPFRLRLYQVFIVFLLCMIGSGIALGAYTVILIRGAPSKEDLQKARIAEPSLLFSTGGRQLAVFSQGLQERISLSQVSPHVIRALIATEDHRFYEHRGVDIRRTLAALFHTAGGDAQGGSTITQQLARNLFPAEIGRARTLERKLKELIVAFRIEQTYTKNQILETYLNSVPFLYQVVGIEMAARTYYDKPATMLNLQESATLIGMLKGTSYYHPVLHPERTQKRRNVVLAQMVKRKVLTGAEFDALREEPLHIRLNKPQEQRGPAPHFAAHLRKWLLEWTSQHGYNLYTDGLIIHSTIDDELQYTAAQAVERQTAVLQSIADVEWSRPPSRLISTTPASYLSLQTFVEPFRHFWNTRRDLLETFIRETPEYRKAIAAGQQEATALARLQSDADFIARLQANKSRLEAGFVAIDPATGEVKAWVGSRDFQRDQFDHVAQAQRQAGSTFKPIVYGAALELGMRADQTYQDGMVEIHAADGSVWRPTDMSGASGRQMSLREGLMYSKNTITAQVMRDVGLNNIIDLAEAVGVNRSKLHPVPSLSLGTSPVTLLEMVSAYSTIAQIGQYHKPLLIRRITDRSGKVLAEFGSERHRAMSEDTAVELIDMMRGVIRYGTGQAVKTRFGIQADIAGKTGTTQNNTDGWFILMHPQLVAGAWVGFNDARITMRSDYWGQGGHNAILLVGDFFRNSLQAKHIDVRAQFPRPQRPAPLITTMRDDGIFMQDPEGIPIDRPPPGTRREVTPDELGKILTGMGRNPVTGAHIDSSSGGIGTTEEEHEEHPIPAPSPPFRNINIW